MMTSPCRPGGIGPREERPGLAEIFRRYFDSYAAKHGLSYHQMKVVQAIRSCRTAALGGHLFRCNRCSYERHEYDSCRNRHCPQCQVYQKMQWVSARLSELLPIAYYHTVFTLPHSLNVLALYNKEVIYRLFFKATSHALNVFSEDPRFLGAKLGFIGILHTWGQALSHHIHLHYIVSAGGISPDGTRWVNLPYRKKFLFPAKALSRRVRMQFAQDLRRAYANGELVFPDELSPLQDASSFDAFVNKVAWENWLCYVKEPFGGPQVVVKYVGRYTHRVAISNGRLKSIAGGRVSFTYKKYHNQKVYPGTMTLSSDEFIRRFLLHVIPHGFKRIRHYGFLAPGSRTKALALARSLLRQVADKLQALPATIEDRLSEKADRMKCPECKEGILRLCAVLAPIRLSPG